MHACTQGKTGGLLQGGKTVADAEGWKGKQQPSAEIRRGSQILILPYMVMAKEVAAHLVLLVRQALVATLRHQ